MTGAPQSDPADPVLERRAQIARLVRIGQRVGYSLYLLALIAFFVGFAGTFTPVIVTIIEACLIVGSLVLAPAITFSFAVRAADRADREDDWR